MSSGPFGSGFNALDSIFNPGRAHQMAEEVRQQVLPVTVDSPDHGNRQRVSIDLDTGIAVVRPAPWRPVKLPEDADE